MREPNALITTEALARDLGDRKLRIFDCTSYLEPPPPGSDDPHIAVPGRSTAPEKGARAEPIRRRRQSQRLVHRQRRDRDVEPVEHVDRVTETEERQKAQRHFPHRGL